MWYRIDGVQVGPDFDEQNLALYLTEFLNLPSGSINEIKIIRKSLDARHKRLTFIYSLLFTTSYDDYELQAVISHHPRVQVYHPKPVPPQHRISKVPDYRPVIVGAGPAGLFAGMKLAEAGLKPIIVDRGDGIEERINKVNRFWTTGELDPESNIQYGCGGAGTFSDGKLTTRVKNPRVPELLEVLVRNGAPPEIRYWQYPHIGTDLLREVIRKITRQITELGGEIRFRNHLTGINVTPDGITTVELNQREFIATDALILAVGNSARDVYQLLYRMNFTLEAKPFAVGLRIEHPQDLIDRAQYGSWAGHPRLGPAEYHLTYHHEPTGRGVYSFCMCPGGVVVGAASQPGGVVTNGMSYHARDSKVANAAIIATVTPRDFGDASPLAGMFYQIRLEEAAYRYGGRNYHAPVQRLVDFMKNQPTHEFTKLTPTYLPGYQAGNLWEVLPYSICSAIRDGIRDFGKRLKGFDWPDAVLTAVETRTSAPVRIVRDDLCQAVGFPGIYPCGEGAGYAGGIVSSALDGWRVAETIIERYL